MKQSELNKFIKSPNKSLMMLSLPVIMAAIVETLYTVVDAIFVGRIGADALAAITFAWPFFFILTAISLGINIGIASRISRFLGEKNKKQAENTMFHGLLICLALSLIIIATSIPLLKPIFSLTGATGQVLQMSMDYMFIILLGVIFMFLSYAITSIFASQGDTKTAMKIDIYSLVLNIILAPIFIFVFHWGVKGAALATTLSVLFAFIQSLYFLHKTSYLRFHLRSFKFSTQILKEIIGVGFPSIIMMLLVSFSAIFLNKAMSYYSVNHVAMFGIVSRLESISILPIYGLSVGAMTLAGIFYGAKKYELLGKISKHAINISIIISSFVGIIIFIFPEMFIKLFTTDPTIISIAVPYLRLDVLTFPFAAMTMIISRIMQGMGHGIPALIISLIRAIIISVPIAYISVFVLGYGYLSIAIALIIGGTISSIIGVSWLSKKIKIRSKTS